MNEILENETSPNFHTYDEENTSRWSFAFFCVCATLAFFCIHFASHAFL
ncbi:MAG: hypothetical protein G01um101466_384 [Parcubacteria group bacterium Gr01-1014_66]|nr:MAG: hypothetical protein G01um101466_384 [Parcubacteria group bacterium Gr01-1014_66]